MNKRPELIIYIRDTAPKYSLLTLNVWVSQYTELNVVNTYYTHPRWFGASLGDHLVIFSGIE
jgi:hypothetical protein